jgi:hypothetical protein
MLGAAVVVIEAAGLWLALSRLNFGEDKVLDVSKAQAGVEAVLLDPTDGYGLTDVGNVVCNSGEDPTIVVGGTFTCDVFVGGKKRVVKAVFQDDSGTYEVDRPR